MVGGLLTDVDDDRLTGCDRDCRKADRLVVSMNESLKAVFENIARRLDQCIVCEHDPRTCGCDDEDEDENGMCVQFKCDVLKEEA